MDRRAKIEIAIVWTVIAAIIIFPWATIEINKAKQKREEREMYARAIQQVEEERARRTPSPTAVPDKVGEGYFDVSLSDIRLLGDEYSPTSQHPYTHYRNIGVRAMLTNNCDKDIEGITITITAPPYAHSRRVYVRKWVVAGSKAWIDLTEPLKIGVGKEPIKSAKITVESFALKGGKEVECGRTFYR